MKVTGFRIQSALRDLQLQKQAAQAEFEDSLHFFANEKKKAPEDLMGVVTDAERRLASLQTVQTKYNLTVNVDVRGETFNQKMSLQEAIKLVGAASRSEKLWREAVKPSNKRDYYRREDNTVRSKENEYAQAALTPSKIAVHIRDASRFVSALREAIQTGNAAAVDMEVPAGLIQ